MSPGSMKIASAIAMMAAMLPSVGIAAEAATAPSPLEWRVHQRKILEAAYDGNFASAESSAWDMYLRCRKSLGEDHPDTTHAALAAREYRMLRDLDDEAKHQCADSMALRDRLWQKVREHATDVLPNDLSLTTLAVSLWHCSDTIPPSMPRPSLARAVCDAGTARICAFARMFETSRALALSARETFLNTAGVDVQTKSIEFMTVEILREVDSETPRRLGLLNGVMEFTERYEVTNGTQWWQERAMILLAENYHQQGNHTEADRLYAEVRSRLPDKIDHDLAGWCKSWCDRHEARQLMEKGDWDAAYEKILQARLGTIEYGHRNLSKGLTMERIVRMSAEIQRHRGNDREAEEDLEYAQLIADHAAKPREALEAELKKWEGENGNAVDDGGEQKRLEWDAVP